jgi:hypothetical protein
MAGLAAWRVAGAAVELAEGLRTRPAALFAQFDDSLLAR